MRKRLRSQGEAAGAFGVHTSGLNDKVGRNAGNGFGLFGCEVFAVISVLFNAVNPLVAEGLVVQTFFEEDAADTGAQGRVSALFGLEMDRCEFGNLCATCVNHNDVDTALLSGTDHVPPAVRLRPPPLVAMTMKDFVFGPHPPPAIRSRKRAVRQAGAFTQATEDSYRSDKYRNSVPDALRQDGVLSGHRRR